MLLRLLQDIAQDAATEDSVQGEMRVALACYYQFSTALALRHVNLLDNPNLTIEQRGDFYSLADLGAMIAADHFLDAHPTSTVAVTILRHGMAAPEHLHAQFSRAMGRTVSDFIMECIPGLAQAFDNLQHQRPPQD